MDVAAVEKLAEWRKAVVESRTKLGLEPGSETELEAWLAAVGYDRFVATVRDDFTRLHDELGIPARYCAFYGSCVLTHHSGPVQAHSAPEGLAVQMCWPTMPSDGYYHLRHVPHLPPTDGFRWSRVRPPAGYELLWPNNRQFVAEPIDVLNRRLDRITRKAQRQFHSHICWFIRPGYIYQPPGGPAFDGRLFFGPGVAGKSPAEVLGLPPGSAAVPTWAPLPLIMVGDYEHWLYIGGGTVVDYSREVDVREDLDISKDDHERAESCRAIVRWMMLHEDLIWQPVGRPRKHDLPPPGATRLEWATQLLWKRLDELGYAPRGEQGKKKLRNVAKNARQAATLDLPEATDALPHGWFYCAAATWERRRRRG